jgi:hypothetical protein
MKTGCGSVVGGGDQWNRWDGAPKISTKRIFFALSRKLFRKAADVSVAESRAAKCMKRHEAKCTTQHVAKCTTQHAAKSTTQRAATLPPKGGHLPNHDAGFKKIFSQPEAIEKQGRPRDKGPFFVVSMERPTPIAKS